MQVIRGVNQNLEGFFATGRQPGSTGPESIILPADSAAHLMRSEQVVSAVELRHRRLYAGRTLEQALVLLARLALGVRSISCKSPPGHRQCSRR